MAIKIGNRAIFYHIPKTAGNWIRSVLEKENLRLEEIGHKHANYDRVNASVSGQMSQKSYLKKALQKGYKKMASTVGCELGTKKRKNLVEFTFVRNPIEWYESWWRYQEYKRNWKKWGKEDWHPNRALDGLGNTNFNEFVESVLKERTGYVSELMFSYTKPEIDFIGKKENVREDLKTALRIANIEIDGGTIKNQEKKRIKKIQKKYRME